ncbi:MAG: flagellar export chaperone FliS [Thiotrichales bacterium]|nr:flagellar export chaperone FliS [Thiotrichales bacterium]
MNMAMRNQFAKTYAKTAVETAVTEASPHKLVEMLYEHSLKNLKLAKIFIEQKNYAKKAEHLNKALSLLAALQAGLNHDKGKEVAENLAALYDYCYRITVQASLQNDLDKIQEVIALLEPLLEAWKQMPENLKRVSKQQLDSMGAL